MTSAKIARKVAAILSRTARVRALLPMSVEDFLSRRTEAEALILNLLLALQDCSDLAMHVVSDRGLGVPGEAREAFRLIGENGVVAIALASRLAGAVGLRNRIAHQYAELDLARVYRAARDDLADLDGFAGAVATAYDL